ncbi:MAG: hypothetical protein ACI9DF_002704 [Verrucomicrobiales bacterium]|jgi:hypothetical protein
MLPEGPFYHPNIRIMKKAIYLIFAVVALFSVSCASTGKKKYSPPKGLSTGYPTPGFDSSYYVKAYRPKNPNNVRVKVSLANQAIYVMEDNRPLMVLACTVGTTATPTPRGDFEIYKKEKFRRRHSSPGAGYPMGYWCEFKSAYGIHAGWVHSQPRSHGCIRMHFNAAPKFFNLVPRDAKLNIAYSQPEDATIGTNILRPRDASAPEFPPSIQNTNEVFNIYKGPLFDD